MSTHKIAMKDLFNTAVIVAALGYFVDIYDLILFSIVRVPSLRDLGLTPEQITSQGLLLLNVQMIGMLLGGILWGVLGDKKGRIQLLFGSIFLYSIANIANGFVHNIELYALFRFIAGVGLAGELGGTVHGQHRLVGIECHQAIFVASIEEILERLRKVGWLLYAHITAPSVVRSGR